jgi:hypothetical protein
MNTNTIFIKTWVSNILGFIMHKRVLLFCAVISLASFLPALSSQNFDYNFLPILSETEKRGEIFYCVYQDRHGFIWFGSNMGIVKYDGYNKTYFTVNDGLPDNNVTDFFEDNQGRLWGKSIFGEIFMIQNDKIVNNAFLNRFISQTTNYERIYNIYIKDFSVYVGYNGPPIRINFFPKISVDTLLHCNQCLYAYDIDEHAFIYGANKQANQEFEAIVWNEKRYEINDTAKKNISFFLSSKMIKVHNNLLIGMSNAVFYVDKDSIVFSQYNKGNMLTPVCDGEHLYWGMVEDGIYRSKVSKNGLSFSEKIFKSNLTSFLHIDRETNVWVATIEDGIYCLPHYKFQIVQPCPEKKKNELIFLTSKDKNTILFALKSGKVGLIKNRKIELLNNNINFVYKGMNINNEELLLATSEKFEPTSIHILKNGKIQTINHTFGYVRDIAVNPFDSSIVYIAQYGHISKLTKDAQHNYTVENIFEGVINAMEIYKNHLIFSVSKKIYILNLLKSDKKPQEIDIGISINGILSLSDSSILLSIEGRGLVVLNKNFSYQINSNSGLLDDIVIIQKFHDAKNELWIGTTKGLSKITFADESFQDYTIQNFNMKSGLTSNIVTSIHIFADTIYVGGTNGISIINRKNIEKDIVLPFLQIKNIYINNEILKKESYFKKLNHTQRNIEFELEAISYSFSPNLVFRHRMLLQDTTWHSSRSNSLLFKSLPYGKHNVEFQVCTQNNEYCSDIVSQTIHIDYPFWLKTWFHIAVLLIIAFSIYLYIYFRIRAIKNRMHIRKLIYEAERKALRAQMNPHFIFNALASIQKFILTNNTEQADYYVQRFSKLIRLILETSKSTMIELKDEISIINHYLELEQLRMNNKFDYEINVNNITQPSEIEMPSMLIQPIVENAIWHGIANLKDRKGFIQINFELYNGLLKCTITDNGVGRTQKQKKEKEINFKTSMGFNITKKRIELLRKSGTNIEIHDLSDEKGNPCGTKVIITI